ncbi:hypothetical protein BG004_002049, partial [Podila humilis]
AVAMAGSCQKPEEKVFDSLWPRPGRKTNRMAQDGVLCRCDNKSDRDNDIWSENLCTRLDKEMVWCYSRAQEFCEAEDETETFIRQCQQSGDTCYHIFC